MPDITQEVTFESGGLNWDDDRRYFAKGDAEYRLNVIPNQSGNTFSLTNLKGNTEYTHSFTHDSSYSDAVYTVIGDCYDDNRDAIYLCVYSTLGNDSILRFNFADNSFDKIAWDHTDLGFDISYPLTDMFMIGDWLHWNPRTTSPRSINVQWAYYDWITYTPFSGLTRSAGEYVRYFNRVYVALEDTTVGHPPTVPEEYEFVDYCYEDTYPVNGNDLDASVTSSVYFKYRTFYNVTTIHSSAPTSFVGTDTDTDYNNIRGRRFQFCFRHYVKDQGYSISSQFTDVIASPDQETNLGEIVGDVQKWNKIDVSIPTQFEQYGTYWYDHNTLFEFVEILFREGPDDVWKIAERVRWADATALIVSTGKDYYTIPFYNDKSYEVTDSASVETPYNYLPITSRSQWSLDGNRSAYGGIVEGRDDDVDVDVTMTVGAREILLQEDSGATAESLSFNREWADNLQKWSFLSDAITSVSLGGAVEGDLLKAELQGRYWYRYLSAADVVSDDTYGDAIVGLLAQAGVQAVNSGIGTIVVGFETDYILEDPFIVERYSAYVFVTTAYKAGSFKNGAWHPFCLYYYDDVLRRGEPVLDDSMRVYVNTLPEAVPGESTNYQRYIDWVISHEPPSWAKYWRWGYAGNQTVDKFWQYNVKSVTVNVTRGTGTDDWTQLDISPLQNLKNDTDVSLNHYFPNSVIESYSWEAGDRVRIITNSITVPSSYTGLVVASTNKDYEILEYDDTNNYIYVDDFTAATTGDDETMIIEIYRPKQQTGQTIYYEFGELYKTYEDSDVLYHRAPLTDQTSSVDATGQFNSGDVWVITRLFSLEPVSTPDQPVVVESYGWSDFHDTEGWGKGKAGAYTGINQKYLNNIRYSNKYDPSSQSSGLSTFDAGDYAGLSSDHGNITAMRQAGSTLKVYFERNSASVLVNKTQFYSSDGVSQVLKSDDVLGDVAYSNYHYGTIFPESVYMKDRTVFFYDVYRSAFVQDDSNGLSVISNNKMSRYFDEKSEALRASGVDNVKVFTSYDYTRDLLMVLFKDEADYTNNECIVYGGGRWLEFASWVDPVLSVEDLFTFASLPESSSTSPIVDLSAYALGRQYITARGTGTFNDTHDYVTSNVINMAYGDEFSFYVNIENGNDLDLADLIYLVITGTGGITSEVVKLSDLSSPYTQTATVAGTLSIAWRISGTGSLTVGDSVGLLWYTHYTSNIIPSVSHALSNFCSYVDEDVWIHHTNDTYNNFWGEQYTSIVEVIGNEAANMKKVYEAMAIHSNKEWDVTEIVIPADETYVNGMESKLPKSRFTKREGVFYSDYLRNQLTNSSTASAIDLVRGEELRGYFIKHRLENVDTVEVILFKVDVSGNVSLV